MGEAHNPTTLRVKLRQMSSDLVHYSAEPKYNKKTLLKLDKLIANQWTELLG